MRQFAVLIIDCIQIIDRKLMLNPSGLKTRLLLPAFSVGLSLISGCMSLPKPSDNNLDEAKKLIATAKTQAKQNQTDQAIASLNEAKSKITDGDKLKNGQGAYYLNEAWLTAYEGHLEFERNNLPSAAGKWKESFDIEYNGTAAQHSVDAKNAKIKDVVINVISGVAAGMGARPGETYTYPIQTTVLPMPAMMQAGIPSGTVLRFPVRVERPPFGNIVRFKGERNYCTASMVTSRVAITAAHCMSNGAALRPDAMSLQKAGIFPTKPMKVSRFYTHKGENAGWDGQRTNDWLILVTDTPSEDMSEYSQVLRDTPADLTAGKSKLMLAGYSSDLNQGNYLTLHYGCTAKKGQNLKGGMYFTNCENAKGSSGAPVMLAAPPYNIVGVHTALITTPKDEFYSVETFSNDFINTLEKVAGASVIANSATPNQTSPRDITKLNPPQSQIPNATGKYLRVGVIAPKGVAKETFIDTTLLKGPQDNLDITIVRNFTEQKNSKNLSYKSEINKLAMNCDARKYQLVEVAYYPEEFARGSAIESHNFKALGANTWLDVPIGTHMENIRTTACGIAEKKS
jgi:V8-like Glu-specific endopeptidase